MKQSNWLLKYSITVLSCVLVITLGISILAYAVPVTTSIGENIATNNLTVAGNATVTGNISAAGTVESTSGGIKFPDATVQTTAGVTKVGTLSPEYMYPEDLGKNWKNLGSISSVEITSMAYLGSGIVIIGNNNSEILRSIDYGVNWTVVASYPTSFGSMVYLGNGIVIGGVGSNVYRSVDYGITWTDLGQISSLAFYSSEYLGNGVVLSGDSAGHIFRSTDYGLNWLDLGAVGAVGSVYTINYLGNGITIAGIGPNAYRSTDYGLTWTGLGAMSGTKNIRSSEYLGNGIVLFGTNLGYIIRSTDYGVTWMDLGNFSETDVNVMFYLGNGIVLFSNCDAEIFRSTDYGLTWTNLGVVIAASSISDMVYLGNGVVVAGGDKGDIARSDISFKLNESVTLYNAHIPIDVTGTRALDTVYQNTSGQAKMISVSIRANTAVSDTWAIASGFIGTANPPLISIGTVGIDDTGPARDELFQLTFVVPTGYYYKIDQSIGASASLSLILWLEIPL